MLERFELHLAAVLAGLSSKSLRREEGQTLVEYALILATISVLLIAAMTFLRDAIANVFSDIANAL